MGQSEASDSVSDVLTGVPITPCQIVRTPGRSAAGRAGRGGGHRLPMKTPSARGNHVRAWVQNTLDTKSASSMLLRGSQEFPDVPTLVVFVVGEWVSCLCTIQAAWEPANLNIGNHMLLLAYLTRIRRAEAAWPQGLRRHFSALSESGGVQWIPGHPCTSSQKLTCQAVLVWNKLGFSVCMIKHYCKYVVNIL